MNISQDTPACGGLAAHRHTLRSREGLLQRLSEIEQVGWDSTPATDLLRYVREDLIAPLASTLGAHGGDLEQAVATGWATAWDVLRDPRTREVASPWGRVWSAVRRAILTETMTARYGAPARQAWRVRAQHLTGDPDAHRLVSLDALHESGWDPHDGSTPPGSAAAGLAGQGPGPGPLLSQLIDAMVDAGWDPGLATDLVVHLAGRHRHRLEAPNRIRGEAETAAQFRMPRWQVRAVQHLLQGRHGEPGLIEQLTEHGPACLDSSAARQAIAATVGNRCAARPDVASHAA